MRPGATKQDESHSKAPTDFEHGLSVADPSRAIKLERYGMGGGDLGDVQSGYGPAHLVGGQERAAWHRQQGQGLRPGTGP